MLSVARDHAQRSETLKIHYLKEERPPLAGVVSFGAHQAIITA